MKKLSVELIMINKKFNFQWVNFDDFKVKIVCKGWKLQIRMYFSNRRRSLLFMAAERPAKTQQCKNV